MLGPSPKGLGRNQSWLRRVSEADTAERISVNAGTGYGERSSDGPEIVLSGPSTDAPRGKRLRVVIGAVAVLGLLGAGLAVQAATTSTTTGSAATDSVTTTPPVASASDLKKLSPVYYWWDVPSTWSGEGNFATCEGFGLDVCGNGKATSVTFDIECGPAGCTINDGPDLDREKAIVNRARVAQGLPPVTTPVAWASLSYSDGNSSGSYPHHTAVSCNGSALPVTRTVTFHVSGANWSPEPQRFMASTLEGQVQDSTPRGECRAVVEGLNIAAKP